MSQKNSKHIGLILLIIGIGQFAWGINLYSAIGSKLARVVGGAPSNESLLLFLSGTLFTGVGAYKLVKI